jgi:hypothetical protein
MTKGYTCCPGWPSGGLKIASECSSQTQTYAIHPAFSPPLINKDLPGQATAGVNFR